MVLFCSHPQGTHYTGGVGLFFILITYLFFFRSLLLASNGMTAESTLFEGGFWFDVPTYLPYLFAVHHLTITTMRISTQIGRLTSLHLISWSRLSLGWIVEFSLFCGKPVSSASIHRVDNRSLSSRPCGLRPCDCWYFNFFGGLSYYVLEGFGGVLPVIGVLCEFMYDLFGKCDEVVSAGSCASHPGFLFFFFFTISSA